MKTVPPVSTVRAVIVRRRGIGLALSFGLVFAVTSVATEPAALAHSSKKASKRWRPPAQEPLVSVSLESAHGEALPSIRHRGKNFVAGEHGDRYEIRVTNRSGSRLEVVVSVDGLDAVSGRPGDFTSQRGYVLEPFGTVVIDGFRTSLDRVAAFRFSSVGDSFAAQVGAPHNAGVVGVAVFKERAHRVARHHHPAPWGGTATRGEAQASPSSSRSKSKSGSKKSPSRPGTKDGRAHRSHAPSRELGTRFGESRHSAVREVSFVRASARRPSFRTTIHYDSARGLQARGVPIRIEPIVVDPGWRGSPPPDAWPSAREDRFSQPPPGWRGRR